MATACPGGRIVGSDPHAVSQDGGSPLTDRDPSHGNPWTPDISRGARCRNRDPARARRLSNDLARSGDRSALSPRRRCDERRAGGNELSRTMWQTTTLLTGTSQLTVLRSSDFTSRDGLTISWSQSSLWSNDDH